MTALSVERDDAKGRFKVRQDGLDAELFFEEAGDRLVLIHTEVPDALEGHGIGGALVRAALDDAADRGLTVVPICPFVRSWLERHPEIADRQPVEWPPP